MMRHRALVLVAGSAGLLLGGCSWWGGGAPAGRAVQPADFAATATQPAAAAPARPSPGGGTAGTDAGEVGRVLGDLPRPTVTATVDPAQARALTVDGMVGQVNGQAIYASKVLGQIDEQLTRLGKSLPPALFRDEARKPITGLLDELVFNSLILGEAERDLTEQEQRGLAGLLQQRREELVRRWGAGAPVKADLALRERTGKGLEETLTEVRQQLLVQRYLSLKLLPRINVTRKDIERYYSTHLEQFQPKAGRTLRLIQAGTAAAADEIDAALQAGRPFAEVAALRANQHQREQGGLFGEGLVGDKIFALEPLNDAMVKLQGGQHSPRIAVGGGFYWVCVERIATGQARSLDDAQQDIEELLRRQRFQQLTRRYRDQVFSRGSYHPVDQMADALVEIAVARYARAP